MAVSVDYMGEDGRISEGSRRRKRGGHDGGGGGGGGETERGALLL